MRAFVNTTTTTSFMKKSVLEELTPKVCGTPPRSPSPSKSASSSRSTSPSKQSSPAKSPQCTVTTNTRRMTVFYTPEFKKHRPPPGMSHPECPARLDACVSALKNSEQLSPLLDWVTPKPISEPDHSARREDVLASIKDVHRFPGYFEELARITKRGGGAIDNDTYVSPDSYEVALLAASTWMEAVDTVIDGGEKVAWALARPPGHHATPASGMGFCLFSNAAIAAKYALKHKDISSVAILDYDVHHGNGTEAFVKDEEHIRFASSHEWPLYPGSGPEGTLGRFDNVLNVALEEGTTLKEYRTRIEDEMLPFLLNSAAGMPDLVIVSAGFDALDVDPLASLEFRPSDYRLFTEVLLKHAAKDTKLVFGLEGGYNLGDEGLGAAVRESIAGYCLRDPSEIAELEDAPEVA